jgi:hypothetical protein
LLTIALEPVAYLVIEPRQGNVQRYLSLFIWLECLCSDAQHIFSEGLRWCLSLVLTHYIWNFDMRTDNL